MQTSEIITIYLALAAPVGVTFYLRRVRRETRTRAAALASLAALAWPLSLATHLLSRRGLFGRGRASAPPDPRERKIDEARRELLGSLHRLEDETREASLTQSAASAHAACSRVERYAGLALALAAADADGEPAPHELETARVAGRTGEDLRLAGRCVHRRNVARINAHAARARMELLHALADLPDSFASPLHARTPDAPTSRRLFAALLPVHMHAIELFRLCDDSAAAQSAARLFDTTAARVRLLSAFDPSAPRDGFEGEEQCIPNEPQTSTRPLPTRAA